MVTALGEAANWLAGQAFNAAPETATVTLTTLVPSLMPMLPVAAAGPEGFRRLMLTVLPAIVATNASLPEATKYGPPVPPATCTLAVEVQLEMFTVVGEALRVGSACVPTTFATLTEVVRPAASRIVIGTPGAPMQAPVGVTLKAPPDDVMTSGLTIRVEIELETV